MADDFSGDMAGELRIAVARAVASHQVDDRLLQGVAKKLNELPNVDLVRGINVCTHGICVDYFLEPPKWRDVLVSLLEGPLRVRRFEYFPWGIIRDDLLQLRVEYQVDELVKVALPSDPIPVKTRRGR